MRSCTCPHSSSRCFCSSSSVALFALIYCMLAATALFAQAPAPQTPERDRAVTLAEATAVRDAFVARIHADGFSCPISVPTILVEDVPSFGQYDEKTNVIRTSDWTLLNPREKAFFFQLAGPGAKESEVRTTFDKGAHSWIFVHELGHWWQACRNVDSKSDPYQVEFGADRISLAYWREVDPNVVATMMPIFQGVLDHSPNPVPPGKGVKAYFNKHYQELGPSPAYPWFQSQMNVAAYDERPSPTFAEALRSSPDK